MSQIGVVVDALFCGGCRVSFTLRQRFEARVSLSTGELLSLCWPLKRGSVHLLLCYVKADSAYRWLVGRMYIRWDVERSRVLVGATAIGSMGRALRRSGRVFLLSTGRISFLLDCFWSVSVDHHHWWMPRLILQ